MTAFELVVEKIIEGNKKEGVRLQGWSVKGTPLEIVPYDPYVLIFSGCKIGYSSPLTLSDKVTTNPTLVLRGS